MLNRGQALSLLGLTMAVGSLAGCALVNVAAPPAASSEPAFVAAQPLRRERVAELTAALPMQGENIVRRPIAEGTTSSVFLVRIGRGEEPHRHSVYDLTVTLVDGSGVLWLDGKQVAMQRGDVAYVPRGVAHHFVNSGSTPAAAIVVFSPKFTGPDSEPVAP